jgi:hypothetical protein
MCEDELHIEKKIWLTGQGVLRAKNNQESLFNVTLQNIPLHVNFMPEFKQCYLLLGREELIMLRNAINKEIKE